MDNIFLLRRLIGLNDVILDDDVEGKYEDAKHNKDKIAHMINFMDDAILSYDEYERYGNEFYVEFVVKSAYAIYNSTADKKSKWYKKYDKFTLMFYKGSGGLRISSSETGEYLQFNEKTINLINRGFSTVKAEYINAHTIKLNNVSFEIESGYFCNTLSFIDEYDSNGDVIQSLKYNDIDCNPDVGLLLYNIIFGFYTKSNLKIDETYVVVTKEDYGVRCYIMSDINNRIERLKEVNKNVSVLYRQKVYTTHQNIINMIIKTNLKQHVIHFGDKQTNDVSDIFTCNPLTLIAFIKENF